MAFLPMAFAQDAAEYDPSPFLTALIGLRAAALTCDPFVNNSPAGRTETIPAFFGELNQTLPDLVDAETQSSLNRFIGSQAASLCRDKLDTAFAAYGAQAQIYLQSKPSDWPEPPNITRGAWCSSENCLEF
ncbi:MAG: hypothetical protein ABS75_10530 [Pelagibacterium sp. SCN 63-23]|nr:MAG: hypothetical protein ABS75_10530 [Pelagibacterium sp. SCN 63-23]